MLWSLGYDWTLLDAVYLQGSNMLHVAQQWRQFFEDIGVLDFLATERTTHTLTPQQLVSEITCTVTLPVKASSFLSATYSQLTELFMQPTL